MADGMNSCVSNVRLNNDFLGRHIPIELYVVCREKLFVLLRGKLTALIVAENDRRTTGPLPHGHQHRLDDELAVLPQAHRLVRHEA